MSINTGKLAETIVSTKRMLRNQPLSYAKVFAEVANYIREEVEVIQEERGRGKPVIPEIDYADITAGRINESQVQAIKRRGSVVVRRVVSQQQARAWNDELADYIIRNGYYETEIDSNMDRYFSTLKSGRPQIFGIY